MASDQQHPALFLEFQVQRTALIQALQRSMTEALFTSRAFLRPADIKALAIEEADAFFANLEEANPRRGEQHGQKLAEAGISDDAMMRIGHVLREFCRQYRYQDCDENGFEAVEVYHRNMVQGFMYRREERILEEQERIRSALQHTLQHYTAQLETASEVARAATSTLDLGTLLTTSVDLIQERLNLDYVAIYLIDDDKNNAELRAATGAEGRRRLAMRHRLKAQGNSTVARSLISHEHVIVLNRTDDITRSDTSRLPWSQSEIVVPLITHDKVIGALSAQSKQPAAFSSQDVVGFQIMCDQLANAIENTRLYVSVQQRADDLAQAYDQLKGLESLKDQFMQNVSHELRTPLTMIRGCTELLLMDNEIQASSDKTETLQVIMRNAQALTELVADIMAMLEVSASRLTISATSMTDAVRDSMASFLYLAHDFAVTLEAELPDPSVSCDVTARQEHLRRIIDNLLANAIKFTPAGGKVIVRLWQSPTHVILEVADTGAGIPVHLLKRIFERFFQVDSTRQRSHSGAGLGLALVKELVESYNGTVSAASPGQGQGSVFTVVLPRAQALPQLS